MATPRDTSSHVDAITLTMHMAKRDHVVHVAKGSKSHEEFAKMLQTLLKHGAMAGDGRRARIATQQRIWPLEGMHPRGAKMVPDDGKATAQIAASQKGRHPFRSVAEIRRRSAGRHKLTALDTSQIVDRRNRYVRSGPFAYFQDSWSSDGRLERGAPRSHSGVGQAGTAESIPIARPPAQRRTRVRPGKISKGAMSGDGRLERPAPRYSIGGIGKGSYDAAGRSRYYRNRMFAPGSYSRTVDKSKIRNA
jgi:hypothetical protein